MSENKSISIYKKLLEIQKSVDVLKKDKDGNGYKFASGENLLKIVRPKMDSLGLLLFQEVIETKTDHVLWKTKYGEKQQTFVEVKFLFTWVNVESGEKISHNFKADGFNDWDKAIGSAMTYAERYYLMKTFHIPTDNLDPDQRAKDEAMNAKKKEEAKKKEKKEEKLEESKLLDELIKLGTEKKANWKDILAKYKVDGLKKLTDQQLKDEIKILKELK